MDEFPHFVGSEDLKEPDANSQSSAKPTNIIRSPTEAEPFTIL